MTDYKAIAKTVKLPDRCEVIQVRLSVPVSGSEIYFDDLSMIPLMYFDAVPTESAEPLTESYSMGSWGRSTSGSLEMFGDNYAMALVSGQDIEAHEGSIALRWCPIFSGTQIADTCNLITISGYDETNGVQNLVRLYYDGGIRRFAAEIYDGTQWIQSGLVQDYQEDFASGTWIWAGMSWHSARGAQLYVSGELSGLFQGSWESQIIPFNMFIGGNVSGNEDLHPAMGRIDSVQVFRKQLTPDLWYAMMDADFDDM